jgi:hypothetical protein
MAEAGKASVPDVVWQGLEPATRRLLAAALAGGLVLAVAGAVWLAIARPVPVPALVLAFVGVGLLIQALGTGPNRLRAGQGQKGAKRPLGSTAWYYGLSGVLMVLAMLEVGVGLVALLQPQRGPLRVVIVAGAAVSAFTAVLGALSTANLTRYTGAVGQRAAGGGGARRPGDVPKPSGGTRKPSSGRRRRRR